MKKALLFMLALLLLLAPLTACTAETDDAEETEAVEEDAQETEAEQLSQVQSGDPKPILQGGEPVEAPEESEPHLVEALLVTEVLEWGETVTGVRLEYSEEIPCNAIAYNNEQPGKITYTIINDRDIDYLYVNDTGIKDDIGLTGKYVFINFTMPTTDHTKYRDHIVFNTTAKVRPEAMPVYLYQVDEIVTLSGSVIAPSGRIATTGEIRVDIDSFETFSYVDADSGIELFYHLYIPEGASDTALPLVVHYPSGDLTYVDDGRYMGALFSHPDCTVWASAEAQAANPCFVVTIGCEDRGDWTTAPFDESVMQQLYVKVIDEIIASYNVDTAKIYGISLAGGTTAMWYTALANPDLFAAMISTSHDPYALFEDRDETEEKAEELLRAANCWFFTGLDDASSRDVWGEGEYKGERLIVMGETMTELGYTFDIAFGADGELMWNGLLRGAEAVAQAEEQLARAEAVGADHLVTLFIPNTIRQTAHWSWLATYSNAAVRGWLFTNEKDVPYTPAVAA